jgi:hypothetical protein
VKATLISGIEIFASRRRPAPKAVR